MRRLSDLIIDEKLTLLTKASFPGRAVYFPFLFFFAGFLRGAFFTDFNGAVGVFFLVQVLGAGLVMTLCHAWGE